MNQEKVFPYYLLAISLLGIFFALIITHKYGAGLSTDGARYLSTAENLLHGRGFYDYLDAPLTQFPPLYSLIIALVSFVTGADVFITAQYLNVLTLGLVIWLAGIFFRRLFPESILYAYIGSGVFVTSISLLRIASNILSDLLFLAMTIIFLMSASKWIEKPSRKNLVFLSVICAVSPLLRFAGLSFILTSSVMVFLYYKKERLKGIFFAALFGFLTSLPTLSWVIFHNYLQTGILFGVRKPPSIAGNLGTTIEKAVHWFIPYSVTNIIPEWLILVVVLTIVLTGNHLVDWKNWGRKLMSPNFLPNFIFLAFYTSVLIFNVSYSEVRWPFMDRIHIIILPSLMAIGFMTFRELKPVYLRRISTKTLQSMVVIFFILWLVYPLNNIQKYLRSAYYDGETSEYNLYNTRAQNESGLKEFIASLPVTPGDKIYSNYEPIAWFYTRHTILKLPQGPATPVAPNPEEILQNYPNWPGEDGRGYMIWMKELGFKPYVLSPDQLTQKVDFQLLFSSKQGDVYKLTSK